MDEQRLGDCYRQAGRFILDEAPAGARLVHGRPTLQRPPFIQFGHAWVEWDEPLPAGELLTIVHDPETGFSGPAALYYALGRIEPTDSFTYTRDEARRMILDYGHWGPWEGPDGCPPVTD